MFQILRGIKILELEPEKIEEIQKNEEIELSSILMARAASFLPAAKTPGGIIHTL